MAWNRKECWVLDFLVSKVVWVYLQAWSGFLIYLFFLSYTTSYYISIPSFVELLGIGCSIIWACVRLFGEEKGKLTLVIGGGRWCVYVIERMNNTCLWGCFGVEGDVVEQVKIVKLRRHLCYGFSVPS